MHRELHLSLMAREIVCSTYNEEELASNLAFGGVCKFYSLKYEYCLVKFALPNTLAHLSSSSLDAFSLPPASRGKRSPRGP